MWLGLAINREFDIKHLQLQTMNAVLGFHTNMCIVFNFGIRCHVFVLLFATTSTYYFNILFIIAVEKY